MGDYIDIKAHALHYTNNHTTKTEVVAPRPNDLRQPSCFFAQISRFLGGWFEHMGPFFDDFIGAIYSDPKFADLHIKQQPLQTQDLYMLISQYWYRFGYTFLYQILFNFGSE